MFEEITTFGQPLVTTDETEVSALEATLGCSLPTGYREFVTTFGEGEINWTVRIFPPWRILHGGDGLENFAQWRQRINKYWFWTGIDKLRVVQSIMLGDTANGDQLCFHPDEPTVIHVLPREREEAMIGGTTIMELISWLLTSGKLIDVENDVLVFRPFDSRDLP
jgi:hypothetical protein